jgi:hypothetical protein
LVEAGLKTIGLEFMPEKDGVPWRVLGCQLATIISMDIWKFFLKWGYPKTIGFNTKLG